MAAPFALVEGLGAGLRRRASQTLYALGFMASLLRESVLFFGRGRVAYRVLVLQILFTGVEALKVIGLLAVGIGVAINFIGVSLLAEFGQGRLVYLLLVLTITRELGPLLTAFVVVARSGTAIATELGGMVVNHEIEAYVATGVNPISYLAAPRLIGVAVSMLVLGVYFNLLGLLGSYAVMQLLSPIAFGEYARNLLAVLGMRDILTSLLKCLVFGIVVATVSCYRGLSVERASTEVPVAGIGAVGASFTLIILADAAMSAAFYLG